MNIPSPAKRDSALLAIIGAGAMARAIVRGAFDARLLAPFEVVVCEIDPVLRQEWESRNIRAFAKPAEALAALADARPGDESSRDGQVLLAIKPQSLSALSGDLAPVLRNRPRTLISILAGTPTAKIRACLGAGVPVVRVMTNTPAQVRRAMTAVALAPGVQAAEAQLAKDLFGALGEVVAIDESLMDAFTALAGSGPAYTFYLAEAMISAATAAGFDRITADRIVRQTVLGSAMLLAESREPPGVLRAHVTSKGGTTEAAVGVLDKGGVSEAIVAAIAAATERGRTLAGP